MRDFRIGYLYSFSPIHCGGEGDLGNILEIAREVHTNFPYIPGSSLRGSLRDEVEQQVRDKVEQHDRLAGERLFGRELDSEGQMGVHQVWFGDARLLWVPMRTMSCQNRDVFTWVSCHSLIRDHAILAQLPTVVFPNYPVGTQTGAYTVADAQLNVSPFSEEQRKAIALSGNWANSLQEAVRPTWENSRIVLPDADFQVLMEHSLWTQIRNKIDDGENAGSAEVFWTDVCIPRDTIFYYGWGYNLLQDRGDRTDNNVTSSDCNLLIDTLKGLIQVGGQANVGRGWLQSWVNNERSPLEETPVLTESATH